MAIRRDWQLTYGVDDVIRSQCADPASIRARRPKLLELSERALADSRKLVEPVVLTRRLRVERSRHHRITLDDGSALTGPLVAQHLGGADEVVVMLCTIGDELDKKAAAEGESCLSYGFALDAAGSAAVHALNAAACNEVEQDAITAGRQTSLPLSPGMVGWGVEPGQRQIFSILEAGKAGVHLSPTLEMKPLKSLTSIVGIGTDIAVDGAICDHCALRDTCRQRAA